MGTASGEASEAVKASFNNMRIIVSLGWSIYPAGYFLGQINSSAEAAKFLNVTYNIADFVNKIAFVLACWSCAKTDSEGKTAPLLGETNAAAKSRLQAEKNRIERQLRSMS